MSEQLSVANDEAVSVNLDRSIGAQARTLRFSTPQEAYKALSRAARRREKDAPVAVEIGGYPLRLSEALMIVAGLEMDALTASEFLLAGAAHDAPAGKRGVARDELVSARRRRINAERALRQARAAVGAALIEERAAQRRLAEAPQ